MEHQSVMSLKVAQHSTVLANAGIAEGLITTSDKYYATKLQREFYATLAELEVDDHGTIDKSQFFEIYVRLGLLKPI